MKSKKFRPYVRRANGREKADSFRMAIRLAFYQQSGRPFFVMVQHGFPNSASAVHRSRKEVEQSPLFVAFKRKTFKQWARDVQAHSNPPKK